MGFRSNLEDPSRFGDSFNGYGGRTIDPHGASPGEQQTLIGLGDKKKNNLGKLRLDEEEHKWDGVL